MSPRYEVLRPQETRLGSTARQCLNPATTDRLIFNGSFQEKKKKSKFILKGNLTSPPQVESKDYLAEVKKGIAPNNENKTTLFDSHSYCCRPGTLPTLCWKEDGRVSEKCVTEDRGRLMFLQLQTEQENYRQLRSSHWDGRFLTAQPRYHLESRGRPHPGGMRFYLGDFRPV